jgi:hypothetical protein
MKNAGVLPEHRRFDELEFTGGMREEFLDLAARLLRDCHAYEVGLVRKDNDLDLRSRIVVTYLGTQLQRGLRSLSNFGGTDFNFPGTDGRRALQALLALRDVKLYAGYSAQPHARPDAVPLDKDGLRLVALVSVRWNGGAEVEEQFRDIAAKWHKSLTAWLHHVLILQNPWLRVLALAPPNGYGLSMLASRSQLKENVHYVDEPLWWAN